MQRFGSTLLIGIIVLLSSCTDVYFTEPQPSGLEALPYFPEEILGKWESEEDGDLIQVFTHGFVANEGQEFEIRGRLNTNSILKKNNGMYYLSNLSSEDGYWALFCFTIAADSIQIYGISSDPENINHLLTKDYCEAVRSENEEVSAVILSPTHEELSNFTEEGLLVKGSLLVRREN